MGSKIGEIIQKNLGSDSKILVLNIIQARMAIDEFQDTWEAAQSTQREAYGAGAQLFNVL